MKDALKKLDAEFERIERLRRRKKRKNYDEVPSEDEIRTVGDYIEASSRYLLLHRNTHHYISDMLDYYGKEVVFEGIYGLDEQLDSIILFFNAHNTSLERRLLLLVGPQGAGKSFTVDKIKKHLELYSHTEEGILFAVAGCPFHQHPFDLIPHPEREKHKKKYGIRWYPEAIPCPVCEEKIAEAGGDWRSLPVERIYISSAAKTGLAKHTPTDLRREDITNFIGNINFSKLKKIGSTYSPDAYDFEGKMIWANRGIFDWTEIFKSRRQLLGLLLELIQSKRIDMTNFPTVHVDEVVIGHTNFPEYNVFLSEEIMEPLLGRIFKIEFPYGLDVENEMKIYRKFLIRTDHLKRQHKHVAEDTLHFVASFAVKTREASGGMTGLSPRFFQDMLSRAYTKADECIDIENVCESTLRMFKHKSLQSIDTDELMEMFEEVKDKFLNRLTGDFITTIIPTYFRDYAQNLYRNYLAAVKKKVEGKRTTKGQNELIEEVEQYLVSRGKISPKGRPSFENILAERYDELHAMKYDENEQLAEAINELVFNKIKNFLRVDANTKKMDPTSRKIRRLLRESLVKERGYCEHCADVLFRIIGQHI